MDQRTLYPVNLAEGKATACFLSDGRQAFSISLVRNYTFVDFSKDGQMARIFAAKAKRLVIPLKSVYLPNESHSKHLG
jgi:hypothetical protein